MRRAALLRESPRDPSSSPTSSTSRASPASRSFGSALAALAVCAGLGAAACSAPAAPPAAPGSPSSSASEGERPAAPAAAPLALDPPPPKLRLPRNFVPISAAARLGIDPSLATFTGAIELTGNVSERSARLWLHAYGLIIRSAFAVQGETRVPLEATAVGEDLLSLRPATPLAAGAWTLSLTYEGRYEPVSTVGAFRQVVDGRQYVATQFESIFARRVFPSFDEPDVKIPWQLTLDVPIDQLAAANTPAISETALDATHKRVVFAASKPLPSYLLAFGVGPYEAVPAGKTRSGAPIRILTFKGTRAEAQWAAETSAKIVDSLEEWFGTPYPYEKLDMLAIPVTTGFGAMENPGLITYARGIILHDPKTMTQAERYRWVSIAGHEVAHQWFGDLVTMSWWDDIWLNEGFARWMEAKVIAALEGKLGRAFPGKLGADLLSSRAREVAFGADEQAGARRVRQPIETAGDIFNAFDGITYDKGASVLTMFERYLGAEVMQRGVRDYLAAHRYGNATSSDFIAAIAATAGKDLGASFSSFLDQSGAPLIKGQLACGPGIPVVHLEQTMQLVPGRSAPEPMPLWRVPVCVAYEQSGGRAEACAFLEQRTAELPLPGAATCPSWILLNAGAAGYYRSQLPASGPASFEALRDLAWKSLTPAERIGVFSDLSLLATTGDVEVGLSMSLIPKMLAEKNRVAAAFALARIDETRGVLPADKQAAFDAWVISTLGPLARSLGWLPRSGDRLDDEELRRDVLEQIAWTGEPTIKRAALAMTKRWRSVPTAVRGLAWGVAAEASPAFFEELLAAVVVEKDADTRQAMLAALSSVDDEARLRRVLALLFEERLDPRDAVRVLFFARTPAQRNIIAAYFQQHFEPLLARLPDGSATGSQARFAFLFSRLCDAGRRDEIAAIIRDKFGGMAGGDRIAKITIGELDRCIAVGKARGPAAVAWLEAQSARGGARPAPAAKN